MFNILAEVISHVGFNFAKPLLFMFFVGVADVFLCEVGKIQEEFIVNECFFSLNKKCLFWISKSWKSHTELWKLAAMLKLFVLSDTWFPKLETLIMSLEIWGIFSNRQQKNPSVTIVVTKVLVRSNE